MRTKNRIYCIICLFLALIVLSVTEGTAQGCSICTRTAMQQGKEAAEGLNFGIVYLMLTPFAVGGYIFYRWWRGEKADKKAAEKP